MIMDANMNMFLRNPDDVKLVDPVHTSTGSVPPFKRTMNLLCGIFVFDRR